jgi:uncharacterized delta-60 repeat protein
LTFNGTGYVTTSSTGGGVGDLGLGVAIDGQNGIAVTGSASDSNVSHALLAIWRFTAAGAANSTFNTTGSQTKLGTAGGTRDGGNSVTLDSQGNVVVSGSSLDGSNRQNLAVWRYTGAGALDTTFNGTGYALKLATAGAGGAYDTGFGVALDSQGRIVAAGTSVDGSSKTNLAIWRYCPAAGTGCAAAGSLDTTFNGTGYALKLGTAGGTSDGVGEGNLVAIDSQGRVIVAGTAQDSSLNDHLAVWRYTSAGAPDTAFNGTGFATTIATAGAGGTSDTGNAVAVDSQGRIVVTGTSTDGTGKTHMAIWRFTSSGALDTVFAGTGYVTRMGTATGSGTDDEGNAIALDTQGRIVVAGKSRDGSGGGHMVVWRYNP